MAEEIQFPVPPDVARQAPATQRPPVTSSVPSKESMDPGSMQALSERMQSFEKLVGELYQIVQVVAPQLTPLLQPIAQAGKALKSELGSMIGEQGGGARQTPGAAPGVTTPEGNAGSPGSVMAAA